MTTAPSLASLDFTWRGKTAGLSEAVTQTQPKNVNQMFSFILNLNMETVAGTGFCEHHLWELYK